MLLLFLVVALFCDALHVATRPGSVLVSAAGPQGRAKPIRRANPLRGAAAQRRKRPLAQRKRPVGQRNLFMTWEESHQAGNLPELDEPVRAASGDNSVALCTVMKDENSTDVREWLSYYR